MYMISCNELTLSSCSISCPVSVKQTCVMRHDTDWLIVLNWILYYDMTLLGELYGAVIFWSGHPINICNPRAVSRVGVQFMSVFQWTHTCGCQQFTVIHISYVYKFLWNDAALLMLLLQYLTIYTVCRCFWEQAFVDWYMDLR